MKEVNFTGHFEIVENPNITFMPILIKQSSIIWSSHEEDSVDWKINVKSIKKNKGAVTNRSTWSRSNFNILKHKNKLYSMF